MGSMPPNLDPERPLRSVKARSHRVRAHRSTLQFILFRVVLLVAAVVVANLLSGGVLLRELREQAVPAISASLSGITHRIVAAAKP